MKKVLLCGSGAQNNKRERNEVCILAAKLNSPIVVNLIATYEEVFSFPDAQCITEYFGDYGSHFFKRDIPANVIQEVYQKALQSIGLSREEYEAESSYIYRANVRNDMYAHIHKEQEALLDA